MKRSLLIRVTIQLAVTLGVVTAAFFVSAGTLNWPAAWICLGYRLSVSVLTVYGGPLKLSPGLIEERSTTKTPGAQGWDKLFVVIVSVATFLIHVVASLDHRWKWTQPMPGWVMWAGLLAVILSSALMIWAMKVNPFFSSIVRLQTDRGHHVVTTGRYRFVRHPGYTAGLLMNLGLPLLLGSLWALIPSSAVSLDLIIRIVPEERFLHRELEGYAQYAKRVRWRLVPGVW